MAFTFTHRNAEMEIDKPRTALVFTDLQNEFLQPATGTYYEMIEDTLKARDVPGNIEALLKTAQELGYYIVHSPHWYYPTDLQWQVPPGPIADYLIGIGFCGRKDPVDLEGFEGSRADYYEPYKKYLMDGRTCNASPHKHFGTVASDVVKQLHMRRVQKVIMAGPAGNVCLESHMRDLIEAGFEVAMVRDAAGAASNEEGDGYAGQMVTWRFLANAVWTTQEAIAKLRAAAA
ncbi:isochorismatase [Nostoc sp. 3335mG]|nr:isochorismatase [Nostoc sp. 3335mG]